MTKRRRDNLKLRVLKENDAYSHLLRAAECEEIFQRMDEHQEAYYNSIMKNKVVFVDEKAGTGKTTVAVLAGLKSLVKGMKLMYIRFPSKRGERLGATPGELDDKEAKYMYPFYEALAECGLQPESIDSLKADGLIETRTDVTERGRNLKECFVIIDEAQNAEDLEQLKLILTRLHDTSKAVVIGHSGQTDSKVKKYGVDGLNAFQVFIYHMTKKSWAVKCDLVNNYRGEVSRWADEVESSLDDLGRLVE